MHGEGDIDPEDRPDGFREHDRGDPRILQSLLEAAQRIDDLTASGQDGRHGRLRKEQIPVLEAFNRYLEEIATRPVSGCPVPRCRIVLPPRTGKTIVAATIIALTGLPSTIAVPTKTLVRQTEEEISRLFSSLPVGVYCGEEKRLVRSGVNVVTHAILQRCHGRGNVPAPIRSSALVFLDEAHHCMTEKRTRMLDDTFDPLAIRIALTATPDYSAQHRLEEHFPDLLHEIEIGAALSMGLLAPVRVWVVEVDADGSLVLIENGDYDHETLGSVMSRAPFFRAVETIRYATENASIPCLISCASRQQAYDLSMYLRSRLPAGRPGPALILGETPDAERGELLGAFERGELDTVIQVGVLIEGWNSPRCKLLVDLAPSMSRVRATQKYFRVMTKLEDREARIYTLLPDDLPTPPVLPIDLIMEPGESYRCGDRIGTPAGRVALDTGHRQPIRNVAVRKRVVAMGSLERPSLDPRDAEQVRVVLESCPDLDLDRPIGRGRFQRLLFNHASFRGTGASLLRWLGVPRRRGAFESFMAGFNADAVAKRILARDGAHDHDESSYPPELDLFGRVLVQSAPDGGRPEEAFVSSMSALTGWTRQNLDPERRLMLEDLARRILALFEILNDRERDMLERRLGLDGTGEETYADISARYNLSKARTSQIVARAVAKLRRKARIKGLDGDMGEFQR